MTITINKELATRICNYIDGCGLDAEEAKIYKRAYDEVANAKYGEHEASEDLAYVIDAMND